MIDKIQTLILTYFTIMALVYLFSDRAIFLPPDPSYTNQPMLTLLTMPNGDKLTTVFIDNPQAKYTLLMSHGNAEDLGHFYYRMQGFHRFGFAVYGYDYPGYGTSEGRPTEKSSYMAIQTAYDYLINEKKISPENILCYGRSLGSGPTIELASKNPCAGLILDTPFLTAYRVVTWLPLFPIDKYRNNKKIGSIKSPMFVVHGTQDEVIPFWHGKNLYKLINAPKYSYWVKGAKHNDMMDIAGENYWVELQKFMTLFEKTRNELTNEEVDKRDENKPD